MTEANRKIVRLDTVVSAEGRGVVLCYGHFNIIHPGHIRYLEYARKYGSKLVIALEGDSTFLQMDRKYRFREDERASGVALLQIVDQIVILGEEPLVDLVQVLEPEFLVLGKEFECKKEDQYIKKAVIQIQKQGGSVLYHAGEAHYASSELLRADVFDLGAERMRLFIKACERQDIQMESLALATEKFGNASLLVIGDTIVDQYVACDPVGMSAEAPVIVVKELESREYVGGAGIVAAHVGALGAECHFISVVGQDTHASLVGHEMDRAGVKHCLVEDPSRPTTFKTRYMVESQKLFRVSRFKEHDLNGSIEEQVVREIERVAPRVCGILVSDFVYGVITPKVLEAIGTVAKRYDLFVSGDLQCSSQVGNVGRFQNFDLLFPTEREIRIALGNKEDGLEWIANTLIQKTHSKNLIMKLGAEGFVAYEAVSKAFNNRQHFPALNTNPVDLAGAGDSLLAAVSVALCAGYSLMVSSAIGACMASLAVQSLGNVPVSRSRLQGYLNRINMNL